MPRVVWLGVRAAKLLGRLPVGGTDSTDGGRCHALVYDVTVASIKYLFEPEPAVGPATPSDPTTGRGLIA